MPNKLSDSFFLRKNSLTTFLFIFLNIIFYIYACFYSGFSLQKIIQGPGYQTLILLGAKENGLISIGQVHRFFFPFSCMQTYSI